MKKSGLVLTYVGRSNQISKISEKGLASPYKPKYTPHSCNNLTFQATLHLEINCIILSLVVSPVITQIGPIRKSAVSFEPFVQQTFALYFWKWQKIP